MPPQVPSDPIAEEAAYIPPVESPYADQQLTVKQQFSISAYWFATNFLWGALLVIMLPGEIRKLVPYYRIPALGILTALAAVVALVVPLVVGALSDRCAHPMGRRRPYMIAGVIINVVGLIGMYAAFSSGKPIGQVAGGSPGTFQLLKVLLATPSFVFFLLAYLVVQLGNNIASAAYSGVIPDLVPENQRGSASGYMALMTQAGTLFGVVGCGALLGSQPEVVKYALVSVVLAGVACFTIFGIKEKPLPAKPPKIHWPTYLKSLWIDPKKYPDFAWVWITRALVMLGFYSILPFINYYLVDVIHIEKPETSASMLIAAILVTSSISGIYGGYISDRVGRKKVVYIANSTIAVMALAFIVCRDISHVLVAGILFGLGFGAYTSVDWAMGTDVLPSKKDAAKEMAVWHVAMTLPQSIAAPVASIIIEQFGKTEFPPKEIGGDPIIHYNIGGYSAVFTLCAVCFALGAYLLRNVRGVK